MYLWQSSAETLGDSSLTPLCGDLVQVYKNGDMANESEEGKEREEPILFCREANLCGTAVEA